jgi:hypothetical protein
MAEVEAAIAAAQQLSCVRGAAPQAAPHAAPSAARAAPPPVEWR